MLNPIESEFVIFKGGGGVGDPGPTDRKKVLTEVCCCFSPTLIHMGGGPDPLSPLSIPAWHCDIIY